MHRHLLLPLLSLPLLAISPARAQMAAPANLPQIVDAQTAAVPGLMDALLKQHTSPQDLWTSGRLNADLLVAVLNEQPWGRTENQPLASQLCALLVEKAPDKLKDPLALPPRTRLRLAQYFKSIKDPRAVTFYEAILSLIKAPRETGVVEVFELSDYYSEIGDWQKAAETRLRMKDYTTAEPFIGNANVEAARMYMQHGETEKADALYQKAQQSSYGWASGMALYDQGLEYIWQGQYDEAIKVLSQSVQGRYSDQIKTALLSNLGYSYYRAGKLDLAKEASSKAIQQYDALQNPLQGEGLQAQINVATETLSWVVQWEKQPIVIQPLKLIFSIGSMGDSADTSAITKELQVLTEHDIPLKVTPNDPSLSVRVRDVPAPNDGSYVFYARKEVIVKVDSSKINRDKEVTLKISSPGAPQVEVTVQVQIAVPDPIALSSNNAFFGLVKAGETANNNITLTAIKPFHILKVSSDAPELQVKFDAMQNGEEHVLQLQLAATESGKMYHGEIHVTTDLPKQRELNIAYYGYAQK